MTAMRPPLPTAQRPAAGPVRRVVCRHPLGSYFVLAFALSWAYWIPLALSGGGGSHVPGLAGPAVAGVIVTSLVDGRAGVRDLLARIVRWRVAPRWYAIAVAPLAVGMLGLAAIVATGGDPPSWERLASFAGLPSAGWVVTFLLLLGVNGYGEEIGWRGVAWPRLRGRHSFGGAALRLAVPWMLWHLPTFWLATGLADLSPLTVVGWVVGLAAGTVVLGWLYERAGSSLLIVALFHTTLNMASATDATAGLPAALTSAAVIAAGVAIVRRQSTGRSPPGSAAERGTAD